MVYIPQTFMARDMRVRARENDVPLTAVHMQETEQLVIMFNKDDVEFSWTRLIN